MNGQQPLQTTMLSGLLLDLLGHHLRFQMVLMNQELVAALRFNIPGRESVSAGKSFKLKVTII